MNVECLAPKLDNFQNNYRTTFLAYTRGRNLLASLSLVWVKASLILRVIRPNIKMHQNFHSKDSAVLIQQKQILIQHQIYTWFHFIGQILLRVNILAIFLPQYISCHQLSGRSSQGIPKHIIRRKEYFFPTFLTPWVKLLSTS